MGIDSEQSLRAQEPNPNNNIGRRAFLKISGLGGGVPLIGAGLTSELVENGEIYLAKIEFLMDKGHYAPRLDKFVELKGDKLFDTVTNQPVDISALSEVKGGPYLMVLDSYHTQKVNGEYLIAHPEAFRSESWKDFIKQIEEYPQRMIGNALPGPSDVADCTAMFLEKNKISFKKSAQRSRELQDRINEGITSYDAVYLAHSAIAYFDYHSEPVYCEAIDKFILLIPDCAGKSYFIDPGDQGVIPYKTYMEKYKIGQDDLKHLKPLFKPIFRLNQ